MFSSDIAPKNANDFLLNPLFNVLTGNFGAYQPDVAGFLNQTSGQQNCPEQPTGHCNNIDTPHPSE